MRTNPVRAKLRSQKGASIIFALFFFIVCAVIGSIVLTAATAAAGRAKDIGDANARYYAVNSAADLLEHELGKPGAWIRHSAAQTVTTTKESTLNTSDGTTTESTPTTNTQKDPADDALSFVVDPATGKGTAPVTALLEKAVTGLAALDEVKFNHGGEEDPLNVVVKVTKDADTTYTGVDTGGNAVVRTNSYNLKIQISDPSNQYFLILICPAHVDERRQEKVTDSSLAVAKDTSEGAPAGRKIKTETTTKEVTIVRTITWSVASVVKQSPVRGGGG